MEKIAMKCTREEYESMRQELLKANIEESRQLFDFYENKNVYLTNDFGGQLLFTCVTTDRKVYETFDKDVFLKACGIETTKIKIDYNPKSDWMGRFVESIETELTREEIEKILGYKIKIVK